MKTRPISLINIGAKLNNNMLGDKIQQNKKKSNYAP